MKSPTLIEELNRLNKREDMVCATCMVAGIIIGAALGAVFNLIIFLIAMR